MKNLIPSVSDLLTTLLKYKLFGVVAAVVTLVTVGVNTMREPDVYKATSILLVKTGREHAYRSEIGEDTRLYFSRKLAGLVQAEMRILRSRDLAERLVEEFPVYPNRSRSSAANRFQSKLVVDGFEETELIRIELEDGDPEIAAAAVNTLVDLFMERHLEIFSGNAAADFLEDRTEEYRELLKKADAEVESFKARHPILSKDNTGAALPRQKRDISIRRSEVASDVAGLALKVATLERELAAIPAEIPLSLLSKNLDTDASRDSLLELQIEEKRLLGTFTETDRRVQNVRERIRLAEEFLEADDARRSHTEIVGPNKTYQDLEHGLIVARSDLRGARAKRDALDEQIRKIDEEIRQTASLEQELRRLERELKRQEKNYQIYAAKTEENRLSEEMDRRKIASISVIQKAFAATRPIGPNRKANMGVGIFFSLIAGLGLPLLVHALRQELSTPNEVERHLGLPVLATIDKTARPLLGSGGEFPTPGVTGGLLGLPSRS